jgi:tetratricopeptide (TPR) repeat protein
VAGRRKQKPAAAPAPAWRPVLWYAALVAATFLAYRPVWFGGLLWDDEAHVIAEGLRSWSGLWQLWSDVSVSQQYYPVASTAFWIMAKLWGTDTFGYHAVNIVLHASSAFLVTLILRRLSVPGALLAGAVFAVHPVYVESVAWISELKNTLSGVCYLGALLAYLGFDRSRDRVRYFASLGLFLLALGTKTVTATLPAAVLVIFWWQRGRIDWKRDVLPLVPFFVAGIAAGLVTAWLEYHHVGAQGARFDLSLIERVMLAGRVVWFYAATIVWPANLMFNYPRWTVDAGVWWQYLFPLAAGAALAGLLALRHRTRAPLAAALFFGGTLFPALGFVNVYPFRFSYVADHFQYLASLGVVTAIAAAVMIALGRSRVRISETVVAVVVAVPLALLTTDVSRMYVDAETLYRETIARNPDSVLARGNLASRLLDGPPGGWAEAIAHARAVIALDPDNVAGHNLLGLGLQKTGRPLEALPELQRAVALDPELAEAHFNLGLTLDELGRTEEAATAYERSLALYPRNVKALHNVANVLRKLKRYDEALTRVRAAIAVDPDAAELRLNLADTLYAQGDFAAAVAAYQDALGRRPQWAEAWNNLGMALRRMGRLGESRQAFETAVSLLPDAALVHANLAAVLAESGDTARAISSYERALALEPGSPAAEQWRQELNTIRKR